VTGGARTRFDAAKMDRSQAPIRRRAASAAGSPKLTCRAPGPDGSNGTSTGSAADVSGHRCSSISSPRWRYRARWCSSRVGRPATSTPSWTSWVRSPRSSCTPVTPPRPTSPMVTRSWSAVSGASSRGSPRWMHQCVPARVRAPWPPARQRQRTHVRRRHRPHGVDGALLRPLGDPAPGHPPGPRRRTGGRSLNALIRGKHRCSGCSTGERRRRRRRRRGDRSR